MLEKKKSFIVKMPRKQILKSYFFFPLPLSEEKLH